MKRLDSVPRALMDVIMDGVEDSAAGLAKLANQNCQLETASIGTFSLDGLETRSSSEPADHSGAYFIIPGGVFFVHFSAADGSALADSLPAKIESIENTKREKLAEVSNILANAVTNSLADACDVGFVVSAPEFAQDSKTNLLKQALSRFNECCNKGGRLKASAKDFSEGAEYFAVINYIHLSSASLPISCRMIILLNALWKDLLPWR